MNISEEEKKLILTAIDDGFSEALRGAFASYMSNRAAMKDEKAWRELPNNADRLLASAISEALYARDDARGILADLTAEIDRRTTKENQ